MNQNDPSEESNPVRILRDDEGLPNKVPASILMDDARTPKQALARILKQDDKSPAGLAPVGAGFLISPCQIITCAHVVIEALGLPGNTSLKPKAGITLDFPLTKSNKPLQAWVQQWYPVKEHPHPGLIEDIAVLEIKAADVPKGARPLTLVKIAERDIFDLEVSILGFPDGYDNGLWSTGTIRGETGEGWYQTDHDPKGHVVTQGFSGAPALDKKGCAVGMIVCRKHRERKTTSYIIPASTILIACQGIDLHITGRPAFGGIIPKMCNRESQDNAFYAFFCRRYENFPNQPQFYICYGEQGECHRSLIERLIDHRIKICYGKRLKKPIKPKPFFLSWNLKGDPESIKGMLVRDLIEKIEPGYMSPPDDSDDNTFNSMKTLSGLPVLKRYRLVIIVHDILVLKWNKKYSTFLEWYIKDYWGLAGWPDEMPQFLIFLNIRYTGSQDAGAIKRILLPGRLFLRGIKKALERVQESAGKSCLLFEALEPVESNDVRSWFLSNMIKIDESKMMELIQSVFKGKQRICMAKIEKALENFHQNYLKEMSGLHE